MLYTGRHALSKMQESSHLSMASSVYKSVYKSDMYASAKTNASYYRVGLAISTGTANGKKFLGVECPLFLSYGHIL